jgi:carboxyl-terminal processing protease
VDLRYNGGGLLSTAEVLANLLGGGQAGQKMYDLDYNSRHSAEDTTSAFTSQPESVAVPMIAFITSGASASASELVVNVLAPYAKVALIGDHTYGKPVGQVPFQISSSTCDSLLFLIGFRLVNSVGHGDYFAGLPDGSPAFDAAFCPAADDLAHAQGSPDEASTAAALQWAKTGSCPPSPPTAARLEAQARIEYPIPPEPSPAQVDIPGLF